MTLPSDTLAFLMQGAQPHAVLDVRERGMYERGHIFRSTSVPRRLLASRMKTLVTAQDTPVLLCDEEGTLAAPAQRLLAKMGYRNVRILDGGLAAWRALGRPMVQGINVPSKVFGEELFHDHRIPEISPVEFAALREAGADLAVVDVRTPEEYRRGCIPGAIGIPGAELLECIGDLVSRPDMTVVVHCGGRTRGYIAMETLRELKLRNRTVALRNGTMGWQLAGFALERGADRHAAPPSADAKRAALETARRVAAAEGVRLLRGEEAVRHWRTRDQQNVYLVDVRNEDEYLAGHAAGATWSPGGQAIQATDDYFAVRFASFLFMCDGHARSLMTAAWFRRMGFADVAVVEGGVDGWSRAGGDLERGHPAAVPFGYAEAANRTPGLSPAELHDLLSAPTAPVVLSVDPSDLYDKAHVPGAGWICASRVESAVRRIRQRGGRRVVMTCTDGKASVLAAGDLHDSGQGPVAYLAGGIRAWRVAGLPLREGRERLLDEADDVVPKPYDRGREAMDSYLRWEEALRADGTSTHDLFSWAKLHR